MARAWTENERDKRRRTNNDALVRETAGEVLVSVGVGYVLTPLRCALAGCGNIAVAIDVFAPFFTEQNRCVEHHASAAAKGAK